MATRQTAGRAECWSRDYLTKPMDPQELWTGASVVASWTCNRNDAKASGRNSVHAAGFVSGLASTPVVSPASVKGRYGRAAGLRLPTYPLRPRVHWPTIDSFSVCLPTKRSLFCDTVRQCLPAKVAHTPLPSQHDAGFSIDRIEDAGRLEFAESPGRFAVQILPGNLQA